MHVTFLNLHNSENPEDLSVFITLSNQQQPQNLDFLQFTDSTSISITRKTIAMNANLVEKNVLLNAMQSYNQFFVDNVCPLCFFNSSLENEGSIIGEEHPLYLCPVIRCKFEPWRCLQCFASGCGSKTCPYKRK